MPFDKNQIPTNLLDAARRRTLIPLVGAGISKQSSSKFPNWNELLTSFVDNGTANHHISDAQGIEIRQLVNQGKVLMAAEAIRSMLPLDEYNSILEEKFNPPGVGPAEIHKALFRLRPPMILSTNYDRLLEDAYAEEYKRSVQVLTYKDAPTAQRYLQSGRYRDDRPVVFKIHGTIDDPEHIMLTERDYRELIYRQPGYRVTISAIFVTQVVLMLGFSFADPELILLLGDLRESLKHQTHPDYIFLPVSSTGEVEARRLRDDFGVQVIPYDASADHKEILELIEYLIAEMKSVH